MLRVLILVLCLIATIKAQSGTAYATYHDYYSTESFNDVACSDGANGLETRYDYATLSPLFPYVTASSLVAAWNSPNCGDCVQLIDQASGNVTVIDHCDPNVGGYANHFDISQEAFTTLFGQAGINAGHGIVNFQVLSNQPCAVSGGATVATSATAASSASASTTGSSCGTYTVQSGDDLYDIAVAHGTDWETLCDINNLPDCDDLTVGEVLKLC